MGSADTGSRSLLLVEENSVILESLRDWVKMTFPHVHLIEAKDLDSGIFLSRSKSPDVVLMDISSLGKGGIDFVRDMRTANPTATVFALVALEHDSYHQAVLRAGADACACIWKIRTRLLPKLRENLDSNGFRTRR